MLPFDMDSRHVEGCKFAVGNKGWSVLVWYYSGSKALPPGSTIVNLIL